MTPIDNLSRGERVILFIEGFCKIPEGVHVGKPLVLMEFQKRFILDIYNNPAGTSRAYASVARKNGKSALIAAMMLAHLVGPEARQNSQIISGARSREQAGLVYKLAEKMVRLSEDLQKIIRIVPSQKMLIGLPMHVEYKAISAEAGTAHGLSPVLAILDEVGQVRGPQDDFIDAIITAQGAYEDALLVAISTQAPTDNDLFSIWLDDAEKSKDPRIVSHVYKAPEKADVMDAKAWEAANPALGQFRSLADIEQQAVQASRIPSSENSFRNLCLNQRIDRIAPFISRAAWEACGHEVDDAVFYEEPVFAGLDLSAKNDLTAFVLAAYRDRWHIKAFFWTPEKGLTERSKKDRTPYDIWSKQGLIHAVPGASIDYEYVARDIGEIVSGMAIQMLAFDRWRFDLLKKELDTIGIDIPLHPFGQGFKDMAPAIDSLEGLILNEQIAHGNNPVLTMCMNNCRIEADPAGNRKLNKAKATGRIDGAVAFAMAIGVATISAGENMAMLDDYLANPLIL